MAKLYIPIQDTDLDEKYLLYSIELTRKTDGTKNWELTPGETDETAARKIKEIQVYFEKNYSTNSYPVEISIRTMNEFFSKKNQVVAHQYFEDMTISTTSAILGIFLKAIEQIPERTYKENWKIVCATGDLEFNVTKKASSLVPIGAVESKYKHEFKTEAEKADGKCLFLYISNTDEVNEGDGNEHGVTIGNITVKRFSSDGTIKDVIDYLFDREPRQVELLSRMENQRKHKFVDYRQSEKLKELEQSIISESEYCGFYIHGESGSGKSALAMEIAHDLFFSNKIYAPIWIKANNDDIRENIKNNIEEYLISSMAAQLLENKEFSTKELSNGKIRDVIDDLKPEDVGEYRISSMATQLFENNNSREKVRQQPEKLEKKQFFIKELSKEKVIVVIDDLNLPEDDVECIMDAILCLFPVQEVRPYFIITSRIVISSTRLKMISPLELNKEEIDTLFQGVAKDKPYYQKIMRAREKTCYKKTFLQSLYDNFKTFPGIIARIVLLFEDMDIENITKILQTKFNHNTISENEKSTSWKKWLDDWVEFAKLKRNLTQGTIMRYYHVHLTVSGSKKDCINGKCKSAYYGSMRVDSREKPMRITDTYSSGTGIISLDYNRPWVELSPRPPYGKPDKPKGGLSNPSVTAHEDDDSLFLNGEVIFLTKLTAAVGGVGLHIPYFTEYVTFTVDMSQLGLIPQSELRARLRFGREEVHYDLLETHQYGNKKVWVISAYNVPPNSNIEFSWGDHKD